MRIWIYGAPFNGKTTFASQFEGAKILSTDGNAEYLFPAEDIYRIKNYQDLDKAVQEIRKQNPKWLIIDTTEYLLDYLKFKWYSDNKVSHESEIAFKGYSMLRGFLWEQIVSLANLCDNVIFISHEEVIVEKNKFGREITKFEPGFEKVLKDKMNGLMTIVMRAVIVPDEKVGNQYKLHIKHLDEEFGGTRIPLYATEIDNSKEAFMANMKKPDAKK